jgi:hypothetical protein
MNASEFTATLRDDFPELRESIDEDPDLVHIQAGDLARLSEEAKGREDWPTFERCIRFADRAFRTGDDYVRNVVYVSYLEHLSFDGPRGPDAWARLTPALQQGWHEIMKYLRDLSQAAARHKAP